jgi:RNA polymerase sigma-70 factor (ECF subfamily)
MTATQEAALLEALRDTSPDLLAYFERRVQPRQDAADVLSELMVQAWRRVDALPTDRERRRMWLFTIAHNVLFNHARTNRRRSALTQRIRQQLADETTPDHSEAIAVRDLVNRLPEPQRELVMLVHWDGFNIREAAELLGLNPSTARNKYAAAREALERSLRPERAPQADTACEVR